MEKTALVTGGVRGIGRSVALELAAGGYSVAVNYVNSEKKAREIAEEIQAHGVEALAIKADVSREDQVEEMIGQIKKAWGRLDVLVNNAGITRDSLFIRTSREDWKKTMEVNLDGAFFCSREAAKLMCKKRFGRIINLSSVVGLTGNIGQAAYSASKSALTGLTKTLAKELAGRNVTVNSVAPGFIETEMTQELEEKMKEAILERIPAGRFGYAEEVASFIACLASKESGYITGQTFVIDGGLSL